MWDFVIIASCAALFADICLLPFKIPPGGTLLPPNSCNYLVSVQTPPIHPKKSSSEWFFMGYNLILIPTTINIFCPCYWSTTTSVSQQSPAGWYFLFICQLTLWNGPLDDGEIGREAFLSNGAVSVDCKCQDASVGDDPAWGVLPAVSPYVWTHWNGGGHKNGYLGLTQYLFVCYSHATHGPDNQSTLWRYEN